MKTRFRSNLEAKHRPLPHQIEALHVVRDLEFAALFHEQGLGKTKIGLDLILYWLATSIADSVIVVTKKLLVPNWERETVAHTYLQPVVLNQNKKMNYWAFNTPARLYLAHYEVMHTERTRLSMFADVRRLAVILDEAQRIKNPNTAPAMALHALAPKLVRRVIMTGTPVANRPYDIWSQVYFLDQGKALGTSFSSFKTNADLTRSVAENSGAAHAFENKIAEVPDRIRSFSVRETKNSAELKLPEKTVRDTPARMEETQKGLYHIYKSQLRAEIQRDGVKTLDDAERVLKRLLRLVQVASNPGLVDETYEHEAGKLTVLDRILKRHEPDEAKKIVWTAFTDNVEMIARRYPERRPARIHGRRSMADRNSDIVRFLEEDGCTLLVATPGSAKEGLTLTVSDHAIFFDRTFSLDDYLQAQDRIHRISQIRECVVENLIATDTVDEWVSALLSAKEQAAALAQGDINLPEYRDHATYDFARTLDAVLA